MQWKRPHLGGGGGLFDDEMRMDSSSLTVKLPTEPVIERPPYVMFWTGD
jgi:hypothetical protein